MNAPSRFGSETMRATEKHIPGSRFTWYLDQRKFTEWISLELGRREKFARHASADSSPPPPPLQPVPIFYVMLLHSVGKDFVVECSRLKYTMRIWKIQENVWAKSPDFGGFQARLLPALMVSGPYSNLHKVPTPQKGKQNWDSDLIILWEQRGDFHINAAENFSFDPKIRREQKEPLLLVNFNFNFNCIVFSHGSDIRCYLKWLKFWPYKVLICSWKILAPSPNTLKEAKVRQNSI